MHTGVKVSSRSHTYVLQLGKFFAVKTFLQTKLHVYMYMYKNCSGTYTGSRDCLCAKYLAMGEVHPTQQKYKILAYEKCEQ